MEDYLEIQVLSCSEIKNWSSRGVCVDNEMFTGQLISLLLSKRLV